MNRNALKSYAPKARLDFIRAVTDRAAFFGLTPGHAEPMQESGDVVIISGRAFPRVVAQQRRSLEARILSQGFDQVMEAMAYTWFNRFMALRYMELHGYLDHGYRVLSPAPDLTAQNAQNAERNPSFSVISVVNSPEILEHAEHVTLPGLDARKVIELKLAGNQDAEIYRMLLVVQCNALHEAMPFLFEKIADATELLLPDNLLHTDSIIRKLVNEIEEADWQQVEIIGWLYQFYISDKKDEVIGKVVKSEDIPAATQLFTPNWIVKYLVQNTLGRQWLATYPDSPLRQQMEYYIEPAEQTDDVKAQLAAITPKSLDPETLSLLDPASGSCHILVEAYDLFKAIYQERGYRSKDIPRLILLKNLFGLEIDDRAAQLGAFALLMKARADDHRIFADHIQPNIVSIQDSKGLDSLLTPDPGVAVGAGELAFADGDLFTQPQQQITLNRPIQESPLAAVEPCLRELIKLFEHGKTFGSLIRVPPGLAAQLPAARQSIVAMIATGQLWEHRVGTLLLPLVKQAELLSRTYDAVVTNPPYMGGKGLNPHLKDFAECHFSDSKADLFAMFIERGFEWTKEGFGHHGMVTMQSWMFLATYRDMRERLLRQTTPVCLLHMANNVMGIAFGTAATVFVNRHAVAHLSRFLHVGLNDLSNLGSPNEFPPRKDAAHTAKPDDFSKIPGSPIAYWVSDQVRSAFETGTPIGKIANPTGGMTTGNNERFLRYWHEVPVARIGFGFADRDSSRKSHKKWFPYNKGGEYRKWYGNNYFVVNWENDGQEILASGRAYPRSKDYYFKPSITYTATSSSYFGVRHSDKGFLFDAKGSSCFTSDKDHLWLLGFLTTRLVSYFLEILNPTIEFQTGDIAKLPVSLGILRDEAIKHRLDCLVTECIDLARRDWDSGELSWNFAGIPLLSEPRESVSRSFLSWATVCELRRSQTKQFEDEINHIFVDAYGLQGEVGAEIALDQITLIHAEAEQDMHRLISYALGCMMGRYSLDKPGLVYAHSRNEGFDASQYRTFPADADGIIPITELAWFSDDATERFVEFIGKAWPREHLEENLKFIADSLGPNRDEHPRDTIRRYLATGFYKDHLQTYKRRPIYWLFGSGKQKAFQCLVYLHRYHEGTMARMRTEYVIPLQGKMSHRIEQLDGDIVAATSTAHRRKLEKERETLVKQRTELATFDEKLRHCADQRIDLDLDDGVKVNYGKFGDLLAEVKAVTGGTEE
jgi:type II restriction/modification system DNA methylase subunit YeeA